MPLLHADYGPSRIPMFLRCPGSVQAAKKVVVTRDNAAAAEGTVAHHVRELCLDLGFEPGDFLGQQIMADGFTFEVTDDMVDALEPGIEWVRERPGRLINEYQVDLSRWMPGQFGTLDVGIIHPKLVTINDLKYGMGIPVDPVRHEPTMAYALGLWDNVVRHDPKCKDVTDFLIMIDQPRISDAGGEWRVTLEELLDFGEEMRAGFEAANADNPPLIPGEKQCMFCDAKAVCPAYAEWAMDVIDAEFDDLDEDGMIRLSDFDDFDAEKRSLVVRSKAAIEKWLKAVYAHVADDAYRGEPTPGLKLVLGNKGPRGWADPDAAASLLLDHLDADVVLLDPPVISPTQVEKLAKKKEIPSDLWDDLQGLIKQSEGKPSLVDEDDARAPLDIADEFDDLPEDEDETA